ncbi:MAG: hypothetical protein ACTSPB_04995 [Candidatus Thorarchaeota archaeon]
MLNWVKESNVLESTDYGFLTNLYLEVIHLAEQMPHNPEGRKIQYELVRLSSRISNRIDDLEEQIDQLIGEVFEATTDEILDESESRDEDIEYRKRVTYLREINIEISWRISSVEGPVGEVPRENAYDFEAFDVDEIQNAVDDWASDEDITDYIDLDSEMGEETHSDTITVEFDDDLAPITVYVECELLITWDGDNNYDSDSWEQS